MRRSIDIKAVRACLIKEFFALIKIKIKKSKFSARVEKTG